MNKFYTRSRRAATIACLVVAAVVCSRCSKDDAAPEPIKIPDTAKIVSADGTANCYIAAPSSTIAFSAAFKGNSTTDAVGEVASAKLLWQDAQSLVSEVYYVPDAKSIVAVTGTASGNAIVAACDAAGNVLWSWHLWVVDYDPSQSLYTTAANASGTTWQFMDRNLGATTIAPEGFGSHGLIYQWGRKDPFTSAGEYTQINEDYSYTVDGEPVLYNISNAALPAMRTTMEYHGTIASSILKPSVFFAMTYNYTGEYDENGAEIVTNDYLTKDWVDVSNDDYWGGVSGTKTIYDPCPVGYKVPVCDADGNTPYAWLLYASMTWDTTNYGATQDGQWFPAAGTRVYASGGLDFPIANPYGGMWIGTAGKASSDLVTYPQLYGQYMFIINGKRTFKVSKDARSQGMSVRCVKE